jgi:hypothetical protein
LLPVLVVLASQNDLLSKHLTLPSHRWLEHESGVDGGSNPEKQSRPASMRLLAVASVSATAALATRFTLLPTSTLGLCSVIFAATGLVFLETALNGSSDGSHSRRGLVSANGTFSRPNSHGAHRDEQLASLRDVALAIAVICGLAAYFVEPTVTPRAISWKPGYGTNWITLTYHRTIEQCLLMIIVNFMVDSLMFYTVCLVLSWDTALVYQYLIRHHHHENLIYCPGLLLILWFHSPTFPAASRPSYSSR